MGYPTFILSGVPVEFVGADGAEGCEHAVEDAEVDVVAEVGPDEDEEGEVGDCDGGGDVVEGFGCLLPLASDRSHSRYT